MVFWVITRFCAKGNDVKLSCLTGIIESRGDFNYSVPDNEEELFWDFYMYSYLKQYMDSKGGPGGLRHDLLDNTLKDVGNKLLPFLKNELLRLVYNSIEAESYQIDTEYEYPRLDQEHVNTNAHYKNVVGIRDHCFSLVGKDDKYYGGEQWINACNAWIKLYNSNTINDMTINDMMIFIDHIFDIHHNSGLILDKEFGNWIYDALNYKSDKDADVRKFKVSSDMRRIANYTLQKHEGSGMSDVAKYNNLTSAILSGDVKTAKSLLKKGVKSGKHDLTSAIIIGDLELVNLLLDRGATPDINTMRYSDRLDDKTRQRITEI